MKVSKFAAVLISLGAMAFSGAASAGIIISTSVGGAPTGAVLDNLDALTPGSTTQTTATGILVSFTGGPSPAGGQAVTGPLSGVYAPPYLTGSNGLGFGNSPATGPDNTVYLTAGGTSPNSSATLSFSQDLHYVGLLWGSVDNYNTLQLYEGSTLVGTILGSDVIASPNGDQGPDGTTYVNVTSTDAFDKIVALSTQYAFEFDNVAYSLNGNYCPTCGTTGTLIPEPITLSLFGAGLAGAAALRRRKKKSV